MLQIRAFSPEAFSPLSTKGSQGALQPASLNFLCCEMEGLPTVSCLRHSLLGGGREVPWWHGSQQHGWGPIPTFTTAGNAVHRLAISPLRPLLIPAASREPSKGDPHYRAQSTSLVSSPSSASRVLLPSHQFWLLSTHAL